MADRPEPLDDLGFAWRVRKSGEVEVTHHGRLAAILRGQQAVRLLAVAADPTAPAAQQLMARLTGNYKRGNERKAGSLPRNRR
jgi:hypothetical protein